MHLHLEPLGGIAGDMFVAAILDAFPERQADLAATLAPLEASLGFTSGLTPHHDGILCGQRWTVQPLEARDRDAQHHTHHHEHRPFRAIRHLLQEAPIANDVRATALAIFGLLAEAEAAIHAVPIDAVTFHEVGAIDSIADIVAAACLIQALGETSWSVGALPLGGGRIKTAHGPLPVPAPATARLLTGFRFVDDGIDGERITPTGAAILRHLANPDQRQPTGRLVAQGQGFGTRRLPGISNCLCVRVLSEEANETLDQVGLISFEIDDQSPEDLALGLERLRALPTVLDVLQIPAFGKKGRLTMHIQILCAKAAIKDVSDAVFLETSTIGLRQQVVRRQVLPRTLEQMETPAGLLRVKRTQRPDGRSSLKVEADDLDGDRLTRDRLRRLGEDGDI